MAKLSPLRLTLAAAAGGVVLLGFAVAAGAFASRAPEPSQIALPAQPSPTPAPPPVQTLADPGALPTPEALAKLGITNPIKIEREHGRIEIKHRDAQGRIVETYLDAATGAVLKQELKSVEGNSNRERDHD